MEEILDYYDVLDRTNPKSTIVSQKIIKSDNEIDIFEQFYKLNNRLKYCNGSYYKFQNEEMKKKYLDWLKSDDYKKKSFDLYYGKNGIID